MKLTFLIFLMTSLITSCADILLDEVPNTASTSGIEGFWFRCEYSSENIGCRFFDDDGYQFTNDGNVYSIETIIFEPDPGCNSYSCFDSFKPSISIEKQLLGSYLYNDSFLTLNPESDTSCTEYLNWSSDVNFIRDSLSFCPSLNHWDLYVQKYTGEVIIN